MPPSTAATACGSPPAHRTASTTIASKSPVRARSASAPIAPSVVSTIERSDSASPSTSHDAAGAVSGGAPG